MSDITRKATEEGGETPGQALMRFRMRFGRAPVPAAPGRLEIIRELRGLVAGSGLLFCGSRGPGAGVPKMAFGPAGGAGHMSACEYADAWFARRYREEEIFSVLSAGAGGLRLEVMRRVPLPFPSIEASAAAADYELFFVSAPSEPERRIADFMARREVWAEREKRGEIKRFDIRAAVLSASWDPGRLALSAILRIRGGGRPEALAGALFGPLAAAFSVVRRSLYWESSAGTLREILS